MRLYGSLEINAQVQTSTRFTQLGAETMPPLLGRGVLLDVAGHRGVKSLPEREIVSARELREVAEAQGTTFGEGDVVLVRTGSGALWHDPESYLRGAGMASDASRWIADLQIGAVGADNVGWDVPDIADEGMAMTLPGHAILLVRHGIYILEHLYLEDLARDRVYHFAFICLPLKLRGATGSPVRPVALTL
jgi:kynurenine formamidase